MGLITLNFLTLKLLLFYQSFWLIKTDFYNKKEILSLLQKEYNFDSIIFLNTLEDEEIFQETTVPQMLLNKLDVDTSIKPIINRTSSHCLTVVYMNENNRSKLLNLMEHLLWKRHLSHILIIWNEKKFDFLRVQDVFKDLWLKGMINVLLWFDYELYTYKPYPWIEVIKLNHFVSYTNRRYLSDFQGYNFYTIFTQFPPRCFSFTDLHGQLVRSGTIFKINELFVQHYNGNLLIPLELDMWISNVTQGSFVDMLSELKFDFLSTFVVRDEYYAPSDVLWLHKRYLIVPTSKEIPVREYIVKTFQTITWLMILLLFLCIFVLIYWANKWHNKRFKHQFNKSSLLQALAIVNSLPYSGNLKLNSVFNVICLMLNLLAGFLLANFFNCSLSSLLVTKLYDPPLHTLEDIGKTQLSIYEYSLDASMYKDFNLPPIILKRLKSDNNEYMMYHRKHLDVHLHIYSSQDDVAKYYLLQQKYMKKPKAKLLEEAIVTSTFYVVLRHRAAFYDHFNRYLLYIKESGIVLKLIADSEWDGIRMRDIVFFPHEEENNSLTLQHLHFGFCVLVAGLMMATVTFLLEIYIARRRKPRFFSKFH